MRWLIPLAVLARLSAHAEVGSEACATCHAAIFQSWRQTGMAQSSGPAVVEQDGELQRSGVRYQTYRQSGDPYFSFDLPGVHGSRKLEYFVGSGRVGRSYLFRVDGFLYQAPVSWYTARAAWDLSPGYEKYDSLFLTRGVTPACLRCHASGLRPLAQTQYGYSTPAFVENGVSCERCHGPGDAHVRGGGSIVNPAKLSPDRRDSICAQCHLSGEARVAQAGKEGTFRPGGLLSDYETVFVREGGADLTVTSHFERLAASSCKKASGQKLWCGSCHDAHRATTAAAYQARCEGCHANRQCARGPDCTGCHMPKNQARGVHATYTDHRIRKPGPTASPATAALVAFGNTKPADREIGLAYASVAGMEKQAIPYLERAPHDAEVLAALAYLYDTGGEEKRAIPLYQQALALDPMQVTAAVNLAIARWRAGDPQAAIRWWKHALDRSPGLENARMSLAVAQFRTGDATGAAASLRKLLELNPAANDARRLLNEIKK